jgi:hypothetical protein
MDYGSTSSDPPLPGNEGIVQEALERWKACKEFQGTQDERTREDIKFANADSRNAWQWPTKIYAQRTGGESELPTLTINKTRVHNDLIINEISKNTFSPKVRPTAGKASYQSAKVMESLFRRTFDISRFGTHKRKVCEQQVDGGIGYILLETAFISERSMDQDIFLRASTDPTGVYIDRYIRQPDGSDAKFGFVFDNMPRKEFNRRYPEWKDKVGAAPLDSAFADWLSDKEIMLCKYWRKEEKKDTLVWFKRAETGDPELKLASEIKSESGREIFDALMADIKEGRIDGKTRSVTNDKVRWYLIAGDKIVDEGDWAGKYIPICRCVGRELVIDKTLDRKGHTRPLIDANRMLNYSNSVAVQYVASSMKSQWLAPARATEGQEQWKTQNVDNYAVMLYNDVDDEAPENLQTIAPPQRIDPPSPSLGWLKVAEDAEKHMMMISGQYQAQLGENDQQSAISGKAINERKEQGDTATYHFPEHMSDMLRFIGVQLLDLYPKIYDTKRALHVIGEDGEKFWLQVDPNMDDVVQEVAEQRNDEEAIKLAFNPKLGEYECVSDPGPDYATQRQEAWNALSQILAANKELGAVCADLLFKYGDFEGAEELRERLLKEIKATKPYLFNDQIEPQMVQLQEQNKRLIAINSDLMMKAAESNLKLRGRDERRDIDAFNADTKRLEMQVNALSKLLLTPQQRAQMEHELNVGVHEHVFDMIREANATRVLAGFDANPA